jgi:hypothetical protein
MRLTTIQENDDESMDLSATNPAGNTLELHLHLGGRHNDLNQ